MSVTHPVSTALTSTRSWKSDVAEVSVSMFNAALLMFVCGWPAPFFPTENLPSKADTLMM